MEHLHDPEQIAKVLFEAAEKKLDEKETDTGTELLLRVFRHFYLEEIDRQWVDHLTDMEHLRDGIGLRGYGQRDPKQEYKKEGYDVFMNMMAATSSNVCSKLFKVQVKREKEIERIEREDAEKHAAQLRAMQMRHGSEPAAGDEEGPAPASAYRRAAPAPARAGGGSRSTRGPEDRAQRPLPVRQRSKIQEVPRLRPRRRRRRRRERVTAATQFRNAAPRLRASAPGEPVLLASKLGPEALSARLGLDSGVPGGSIPAMRAPAWLCGVGMAVALRGAGGRCVGGMRRARGPKFAERQGGRAAGRRVWPGVYYNPVYGYLHMVQQGDNVVGRWKRTDASHWGELSGTAEGNVMHFTWTEHQYGAIGPSADIKGTGVVRLQEGRGRARARRASTRSTDSHSVGNWNCVKQIDKKPDLNSITGDNPTDAPTKGDKWQ